MSGLSTTTDRHIATGSWVSPFFVLLVILLWMTAAHKVWAQEAASTFNQMLMPGPVHQTHREYENQCEKCHESFNKGAQDTLCLDCHEEQAADIDKAEGYHGRIMVEGQTCNQCHTEHEGRTFDIVGMDRGHFDHGKTDFVLEGAHKSTECSRCHEPEKYWREAPSDCHACHEQDDHHKGKLGENCEDCHVSDSWLDTTFDHDDTDFILNGAHATTSCLACHPANHYDETPSDCASCHTSDDTHGGVRGIACEDCHTVSAWDELSFDHDRDTEFSLIAAHKDTACESCHHRASEFTWTAGNECIACHRIDDTHAGRNGEHCDDCHNVSDGWDNNEFDHNKDTDFSLQGAHKEAPCEACHRGSLETELSSECIGCHKAVDVHEGVEGKSCDRCHSDEEWANARGFDHSLTNFPLLGMHSLTACSSCHEDHKFAEAELECEACHEKDNVHGDSMETACSTCHDPVTWSSTRFNHDDDTDFPLEGVHSEIQCESCHASSYNSDDLPDTCFGCHRSDDRHRGHFGTECGTCHQPDAWNLVEFR